MGVLLPLPPSRPLIHLLPERVDYLTAERERETKGGYGDRIERGEGRGRRRERERQKEDTETEYREKGEEDGGRECIGGNPRA